MAMAGVQYRQGDVLLVAASGLPTGLEPVPLPPSDDYLLAEAGAPSGESHLVVLSLGVRAFRAARGEVGADWLHVTGGGVTITHPEHAPIRLESGYWRVVRQ